VSFHQSMSLGSYGRLTSEVVRDVIEKRAFWKKDPLRKDFENLVPKGFTMSQIHVLCANFVNFGRPEIGKVVRYLPDKKKQKNRLAVSLCSDRAQNLTEPATNNVLTGRQISSKIGSLPAEL